jgi:hypothetical protein
MKRTREREKREQEQHGWVREVSTVSGMERDNVVVCGMLLNMGRWSLMMVDNSHRGR